jgi:hypothetical protein
MSSDAWNCYVCGEEPRFNDSGECYNLNKPTCRVCRKNKSDCLPDLHNQDLMASAQHCPHNSWYNTKVICRDCDRMDDHVIERPICESCELAVFLEANPDAKPHIKRV